MSVVYEFVLTGYIKPAVRMTGRGKWVSEAAKEHLACKAGLAMQYQNQMALNRLEMLPKKTPIGCSVNLVTTKNLHKKDFDNLAKMVTDSAAKIVFSNDSWIDYFRIEKVLGDEDLAIVKYWIL